jgi:hypothetical protein
MGLVVLGCYSFFSVAPGPYKAFPARTPVCVPLSTVSFPFTNTYSKPTV